MITVNQLGLVLVLPFVVTTIGAIAIVRAVNQRQAGLAQVAPDRTSVPTRPDVPPGAKARIPETASSWRLRSTSITSRGSRGWR